MALLININMRTFTKDQPVYRLIPGHRFRYYDIMREHDAVFLDLPGLLYDENFPFASRYNEDAESVIRAANYADSFHRAIKKEDFVEGMYDIQDIEKKFSVDDISEEDRVKINKRIKQYFGWIRTLYYEVNTDDVVVVPSPKTNSAVGGYLPDCCKKCGMLL